MTESDGLLRVLAANDAARQREPEEGPPPVEPEWLAGIQRGATPCKPPERATRPRERLDDSRSRLLDRMDEYVADPTPSGILVVKAAAGLGKTTLGIRIAEKWAARGRKVFVPGPRHIFFEDILRITKHPEMWYHWWPRQGPDAPNGGPETCTHKAAIDTWMRRGYRGIDFCKQVCTWADIEGLGDCVYHKQKLTPKPIIFGQHQHVVTGHPMHFDLVIGDECPLMQFKRIWTIPPQWIYPGEDVVDPVSDLAHLTHEMAGIAVSGEMLYGHWLIDKLGGAQRIMDACKGYYDNNVPKVSTDKDVESKGYAHMNPLVKLLAHEAEVSTRIKDYVYRVILGKKGLTLFLRHELSDELPPHMIWLDATARGDVYSEVMRRPVDVLDAQPEMRGRIYQVIGRQYHKGSVTEEGDFASKSAKRMIEQAVRVVNHVKEQHGYKRAGIITYKDLADRTSLFPDMLCGHFYGARGTNAFEECDALFVLGAPSMKPIDLEDTARCLFDERDNPFRANWTTLDRPFNYVDAEGHGWQHQVAGYWHDANLQVLQAMTREDEIEQAVHRARPLHRDVDVWLITTIPIENVPLTGLLTYSDVFGMPKDSGVNVWMWEEIMKVAEEAVSIRGIVTTLDMIDNLGVTQPTACRYIHAIGGMPGWEEGTFAAPKTAGRQRLTARPMLNNT